MFYETYRLTMMNKDSNRRRFMKTLSVGAAAAVAGTGIAQASPQSIRAFSEMFGGIWGRAKATTLTYAEQMPEEHYSFKPTSEIRSFAEQMLHIAGSSLFFANKASDMEAPQLDTEAEGKSKEDVIAALNTAFDFASEAISSLDDTKAGESIDFFGNEMSRQEVLWFMRDHVTHHRGQTVIYFRLKDMQPPQYNGA